MSDIVEFGFDDEVSIQNNTLEPFKQERTGQKDRVSIIVFKRHNDKVIEQKVKEAAKEGKTLTEQEKAQIFASIDAKIAEKFKKPISEVQEIDRLDTRDPKWAYGWNHYREDVGVIKCMSTYEGPNVIKKRLCCQEIGEASQALATIIMRYPLLDNGDPDTDLLKMRKQVRFQAWKVSPKKFAQISERYLDERKDNNKYVLDLKLQLEGEPKFQKQIMGSSTATWAREDVPLEVKQWILEAGITAMTKIKSVIGFEIKEEALVEKLRAGGKSVALGDKPREEDKPRGSLQTDYGSMLT